MSGGWATAYLGFRMRRPLLASLTAGLILGLWVVVLVGRWDTAAVVGALFSAAYFYCYRSGGPLRQRVLREYDESGNHR